ncbi:MAG: type II secretion system F family protein, partial [Clostridia bacterium]|nr:type II secretion system F family protein [Clostridia bacterium]
MPTYRYVALNAQRQRVKGMFIAEDEQELAAALAKNNLYLQSAKLHKEGTPSAFFTMGTGKVSMRDLTGFCRHISIMITAGIPVPDCLETLKKQSYSGYFRSILSVVYDDVKAGMMLSEAFDKHKKSFPNFFRSMVRVGEASGRLDTVFVALADYYETDAAIKRKARSALIYPMFLMAMTVGIVALMLAFVIPTFKDALADLDVEITGFTKFVYDLSDFLIEYGRYLILGFLTLALLVFL